MQDQEQEQEQEQEQYQHLPWMTNGLVADTQVAPQHLGFWPTPLHPLRRLSEELGGPTIWLKRDDCSGLATGGNKTRKLEYLLGEAVASGADTVITFGAVQSNHARQTAAACAQLGLACHVVLSRRVPIASAVYETGGNVLLDEFLGAQVHIIDNDAVNDFTAELIENLEGAGRRIYSVPPGGSNPMGALGYAQCALELDQQLRSHGITPQQVFHASASSGTQAGLIYGFGFSQRKIDVCGINVFHQDPGTLHKLVERCVTQMDARFGEAPDKPDININHAYIGEGYGLPTKETLAALHLAAEMEGILFDPVYSGKALCGLLDQINLGNLSGSQDVVLIHTGGAVALNVYADQIRRG